MTAPRKLSRAHFAFMRALAQGLDLRVSWAQYLGHTGERDDLRVMRSTVAWIRNEFAAAAKRQSKPGTARLILIDPEHALSVATGTGEGAEQPTLEVFALERGLEDFSEAEQAEAYAEAFGARSRNASRRARLIERQLDALNWLEALVAEQPRAGDGVGAWLAPSLAVRLERSGVPTLFALVERINGIGARWWTGVPGVGQLKAERVVHWLRSNQESTGLVIGSHVDAARSALAPAELSAVVPHATALVPLEKFIVPPELDGRTGRFRAAAHQCLLDADDDLSAIHAWLASKRAGKAAGSGEGATHRAYRKEAERLLLWTVLERNKPLSSLTVEDATAYTAFLQAPPAHWCGPRHRQRWSPLWRPLEGPLNRTALRYSLTVLRGLYAFLVAQNYVIGNPFSGVASPAARARPLGSSRALSFDQWDTVAALLQAQRRESASVGQRRTARAFDWLYATGLRISELVAARCADLERIEFEDAAGQPATGWLLTVLGKGERVRQVPVPAGLVDALGDELQAIGRERDPGAQTNAGVPVLADFASADLVSWSASGLYKTMKATLGRCADGMEDPVGPDASRLRLASPHWMRHTHGTHALNGRKGHAPVPVQVVQNNLGHASIGTTSGYLTTERDARLVAMQGFWVGGGG